MIIFKDDDVRTNTINSVKAAFEIAERSREFDRHLPEHIAPISVNMGIHSGIALLGLTRFKGTAGTRMTYTASGPVTNLAARLADRAEGGDILIAEEAKHLIDGIWPTYPLGPVKLKGIEEPVQVYSLVRKA